MKLIEQISADFLSAYKESKGNEAKKAEKDFLGVLKTEVTKESKEPEDAFVVGKIKTMIKNAAATDSLSDAELNILENYLPTQMSEDLLKDRITSYIGDHKLEGRKDMGKVMGFLKSNFDGQYDGKLASSITIQLLG